LFFPLLHIDTTYAEQRKKLIEEYNEFRRELFTESSHARMFHELQDIVQAYLTTIYAQIRETCINDAEADEKIIALIEYLNQEHRKKIERYKAERGWN
jgi:hypothetical protein